MISVFVQEESDLLRSAQDVGASSLGPINAAAAFRCARLLRSPSANREVRFAGL
jgi:hypothetical protein